MRRPCAALLLLLRIAFAKLLRINEWYALTLPPLTTASLELNLFYSCDSSSLLVKTGKNSTTRMLFYFDGDILEKTDVDSTRISAFPQTHRVLGGCREQERKVLNVNVTSAFDFFEIRVDGQVFRRPKARRRTDQFEIAIPQETPCCVIRAVLKTDSDDSFIEVVSPSTTAQPTTTNPAPTTRRETTATGWGRATTTFRTRRPKTVPPTTSSHEYKLYSWTDVVNQEWSITFIVTAVLTCLLMGSLVLFGLISFVWLLTKPKDGGLVYRVETPGLY